VILLTQWQYYASGKLIYAVVKVLKSSNEESDNENLIKELISRF